MALLFIGGGEINQTCISFLKSLAQTTGQTPPRPLIMLDNDDNLSAEATPRPQNSLTGPRPTCPPPDSQSGSC